MPSSDQIYTDYSRGQAFTLLFVQLFFILVMFGFLIYWHVQHPDSVAVTKQYQKELLERNQPEENNNVRR